MKHEDTQATVAQHVVVRGVVQGVGFRPFVCNLATEMALAGWVLNHSGGVDIEVEGPEKSVADFIASLAKKAPPLARIASIDTHAIEPAGYDAFEIRHSQSQAGGYQLVSPDVATCPDCLRELLDPDDRRYRYPFINCTNCGPRFTIIEDIPYDRPMTTMRVFPMCDQCRAEYEDPRNRRFHAQPNACPICGPQVWLVEANQQIGKWAHGQIASQRVSEKARKRTAGSGIQNREPRVKNPESRIQNPTSSTKHPVSSIEYQASSTEYPASGDAALVRAAELLRSGRILAIKGLGGFHLACDATNAEAVALLRARKRRPSKPFALMVATPEEARALCCVDPEAEALLTSPQCPIVLLDARPEAPVAVEVAPASHTLGIMLAYTPLHHVLLRDVGRPLVMTSGNLSEEPIAKDNDEALQRLSPLADAFLLHNRDIHARYDDTVVQMSKSANGQISNRESASGRESDRARRREGEWQNRESRIKNQESGIQNQESGIRNSLSSIQHTASGIQHPASSIRHLASNIQFLRRARGYAPLPVRLPFSAPQIYAAGPLLKNTFTLTRDDYAFVSQHIGDLESLETLEHHEEALATYQHLFRIEPEQVACDLHPDYLSTRHAEAFAGERGLPAPYRVQHHKAHIAACLAENGWTPEDGPVIGVALDGTGYGEDGEIWGGEWFLGGYHGFERAAHLEYLPLPGGDAATRQPWRIAVAYLHALGADELMPLGELCPSDVMRIRTMVDRGINTPRTSSMGRLFDAVSALLGICHEASYEAQAAIELEQTIPPPVVKALLWDTSRHEVGSYPYTLDTTRTPHLIRVGPLIVELMSDVERAVPAREIALRFHLTIADMITTISGRLRDATGISTVALSGGVFQNRLMLACAVPRLALEGFDVMVHQQVPPNDGGISLGQAAIAAVGSERPSAVTE
jgi:hydrogenase maturation protein HypF